MAACRRGALFSSALLLSGASGSVLFSSSSVAVLRAGSGAESTTPGTALPVYFDEVAVSSGSVVQSVLYNGAAFGGAGLNCSLPAPGASGSTWLYDADGIPTASLNGISWPCYSSGVGSMVDMNSAKTFVMVGSDMSSPTAWAVTTHVGVRSTGLSGLRQIITLDGANYYIVGNAADYNGLRLWSNGASASSAISGAGVSSGQPGYNYAISFTKDAAANTLTYMATDTGVTIIDRITVPANTVSTYTTAAPTVWSVLWTTTANTFWSTFDGGASARGSVGRFFRSVSGVTTQYNISIDPSNVLYSLAGTANGECAGVCNRYRENLFSFSPPSPHITHCLHDPQTHH